MIVKEKRESLNMTQFELAEKLNVSRTTVTMWETGQAYPRVEILIKLSEIFNCTLDELVKGEK